MSTGMHQASFARNSAAGCDRRGASLQRRNWGPIPLGAVWPLISARELRSIRDDLATAERESWQDEA